MIRLTCIHRKYVEIVEQTMAANQPPPYGTIYPPANPKNGRGNGKMGKKLSKLQSSLSLQEKRIQELEMELKQAKAGSSCKSATPTSRGAGYEWVDSTHSGVPPMAIQVCSNAHGHGIFVGRANFCGEVTPAHVTSRVAYVPHYGLEYSVDNYHVLCTNLMRWVPCSGGYVPPGAVQAGCNRDGAPLFVGRVHYGCSFIVGKVHPKFGVCYYPCAGKEERASNYDTLVFEL